MIRALLNILQMKAKETVFDPFVGSGTTAVEAQLLGINCVGRDTSPPLCSPVQSQNESVQVIDKIKEYREEATTAFTQ